MRPPEARPVPGLETAHFALVRLHQPLELSLLHPEERLAFGALATDARRREWWGGRAAARGALAAIGAPEAWVLSDPRGVPELHGPGAERCLISISHGRRWSVAMVMPREARVGGIGVDAVEPEDLTRLRRLERRVFDEGERARFGADGLALGAAWAAKEALAKATATGMWAFAMRHVRLSRFEPETGDLAVDVPGAALSMLRLEDETLLVFAAASPALVARANAIADGA